MNVLTYSDIFSVWLNQLWEWRINILWFTGKVFWFSDLQILTGQSSILKISFLQPVSGVSDSSHQLFFCVLIWTGSDWRSGSRQTSLQRGVFSQSKLPSKRSLYKSHFFGISMFTVYSLIPHSPLKHAHESFPHSVQEPIHLWLLTCFLYVPGQSSKPQCSM